MIRRTKFAKSRLVPLDQLAAEIEAYMQLNEQYRHWQPEHPLLSFPPR